MSLESDLRASVEALRAGPAYGHYRRMLSWVLRCKEAAAGGLSRYWAEELAGLQFMFDASPLLIEKLRHHCHPITGVRPYDYRSHKDKRRLQHEAKLQWLTAAGGAALRVPEPPLLGGFGFPIDGGLYNVDTLKYLEVMLALDRGAVLTEFREAADRRYVLEIGPGWGGLAYQFKTLFPRVTYILVDLPELFLFSGTYLSTAFPEARVVRWGETPAVPWEEADFVLVPHTALDALAPPRLDLVLNTVSFQEMTAEQVEAYVRRAHELGARYLYSLNRDRSPYNPEIASVRRIIERWFWPHELFVLPVDYTQWIPEGMKAPEGPPLSNKKPPKGGSGDNPYRHVLGFRRETA